MKIITKNIAIILLWIVFTMFFGVSEILAESYSITADNNDIKIETKQLILDTDKQIISGTFFSKKIGEKIRIPETKINCNFETNFCGIVIPKITSEIVGEIKNTTLRANLNTQIIETVTSGQSFIGSISISANLENTGTHLKNLKNRKANHETIIEIGNAEDDKMYELEVSYNGQAPQKITAINNQFEKVDLSLTGKYHFTFIVKNIPDNTEEKRIEYKNIDIVAGDINKNIAEGNFYAKSFCEKNSKNIQACPDGKNRKWSEIISNKNTYLPWETAIVTIKLRDKYGNRVNGEDIEVELKNSVKNNQTNTNFPRQSDNVVTLYPTKDFLQNTGTLKKTSTDYSFQVKSLAPTDEGDNILQVAKVYYKDNSHPIDIDTKNITYTKPFGATENISDSLLNGVETNFHIQTHMYQSISVPHYIVGRLSVWGYLNEIKILSEHHCYENYLENWYENPLCKKEFMEKFSLFGFSDDAQTITIKPEISSNSENGKLEIFAGYALGGKNILYKISEKNFTVVQPESKDLTISNGIANVNLDTTSTDTTTSLSNNNTRTKLLNIIEKNIAYLNRNANSNFNNKNYEIITWDKTLSDSDFVNKRSYIILGGDVTIKENIFADTDEPVAIIALSRNGSGGNIKIAGNVTNINTTLIAENSILGADDIRIHQLAIVGSIMANNICKDAADDNCLLNLRKDFKFIDPDAKSRKAIGFENNPDKIIIQYNPNIRTNPPPGLENFAE